MELKDKPKRERVIELVDLARRRTRRKDEPEWATGVQLIVYGASITVVAGLIYLAVMSAPFSAPFTAGRVFIAFVSAVASSIGSIVLLAGIVRWAVQPLIYYQQKTLEKIEQQDEREPPV